MNKDEGYAILSVLIVATILGWISANIALLRISTLKLQQVEKNHAEAKTSLLSKLSEMAQSSDLNAVTETDDQLRGLILLKRDSRESHLYRTQEMFSLLEDCQVLSSTTQQDLSDSSPHRVIALSTCRIPELDLTTPQNQFRTRGNFISEKVSGIDGESFFLISNGFMKMTELSISGDGLILAGGDIFIERLVSHMDDAQLSIISLTGGVTVHSIPQHLSIYVDALQFKDLPAAYAELSSSPHLEFSPGWIEGVRLGRDIS